ncbi:MAG: type IV secretory system conjugative DNA transfer family protein [Enterobacterales bacterium]|nr:type IV secretory system conjugative DNA transfer family protein [Enterobacterales bacterium]
MKWIISIIILLISFVSLAKPSDLKNLQQIMQMTQSEFLNGNIKELRKKQVRSKIIESEATRYASQLAFIQRLNQLIDQALGYQQELDEIFDFHSIQQLATEQLDNVDELQSLAVLFLPPVLAKYTRVRSSDQQQLFYRNAEIEYQIKQPARLTEQLLDWRFFLTLRPYDELPSLAAGALPKDSEEQSIWKKAAKEGWKLGLQQANQVMQDRLQQLMLTHKGMLDYVILVDQNMVKPPQVSLSTNATEISNDSNHLAINVLRYQIRYPAKFNADTSEWDSKLYSGELQIRREQNLNVSAN